MRFWDYLRYRRRMLLAAAVCCVIFAASFALYRLPLRAVLYPVGLCLLVGLGFAVWDYRRTLKRHRALTGCGDLTAELLRELPPPESLAEEDYRAQLLHLRQLCTELQSAADNRYRDAIEYYTTWAHQIKTPIASMRLALQGEDTALFRRLLSDLSRTEQYVEMVMAGLHLAFAFPMIRRLLLLFNLNNVGLFALTTVISFVMFGVLYALIYRITGNVYYRIVSDIHDRE